jgi:uncharacterized RDD family membrane protein YckC
MSSDSGTTVGATPPPHPFDEMWYVQSSGQALGPYRGHDIKAMIERGSIGAQTWVAKVGASQWIALADVPAFASLGALRSVPGGPIAPLAGPRATAAGVERPLHFAGFWIRVLAYIVDQVVILVIVTAVSFVIGIVFGLAAGGRLSSDAQTGLTVVVLIAEVIIIVAYQMISLSSRWQATPGKRLCGIYVIRANGAKIGPGLALGRYLSVVLSAMILYIGLIMVAFTNQKRGLHDMICNTRVIYGKAEDDTQIADIFS